MQLGGKLGTGGAGADDGNVELAGPHRPGLRLRADTGVDEAVVEADRLLGRVERDGVAGRTRRAEIVGDAADGDDQGIVRD